jgi:SAM-dependent methyltransferase
MDALPEYERLSLRMAERSRLAEGFARQIELTAGPRLDRPLAECNAIDIGCGYGYTAAELATRCRRVVGIEPNAALAAQAGNTVAARGLHNLEIRQQEIGELPDVAAFDLAIMDNVLEHIEDQRGALRRLSQCLRPGGVAFLLVPNRYWPIEVHYKLPFLSYLPLSVATSYLRLSGRGTDYRDASYAPSYLRLQRLLRERPELDARLTLPADVGLAEGGGSPAYRAGVALLRRFPAMWAISKAFLVVAKKFG